MRSHSLLSLTVLLSAVLAQIPSLPYCIQSVSHVTSENTNVLAGMGQQRGTTGRAGAGKGSFPWIRAGAALQLEKSKS